MTELDIKQQNAQALAAGYHKPFRMVEVTSIVSFWAIIVGVAVRAFAFRHSHPGVLIAALVAGLFMADFVGGFVHWMGDTWGSTEMPILGKALIRPFREHHVDEQAMVRHDYIETNGANCMISVPVVGAALFTPLSIDGWVAPALFAMVSIGSMVLWVMMTNQIHKWSHLGEARTPRWLKLLQRMHLVLPPDHHQIHHTAPFDTYYCITTGWLNWPLAKIGFYRRMERLVSAITGLIPRRDDIGLEAALKLAPGQPPNAIPPIAP
jgi:ubiquitin-conjugating enzyme E2 variant